jgi:hypothetical protein
LFLVAAIVFGACSSTPSASPTSAPASATATITLQPTATAVPGFIYWALDRGPEGTPDQDRLRLYLFVVRDFAGAVKLIAPDGSVAGTAGVLGSGIFSADSCVVRVPNKDSDVRLIGIVQMTAAAQAAFLSSPATYYAEIDRTSTNTNNGTVVVRLVDSGCRPR